MTGILSDTDAKNSLDVRFGGATPNAPATYYAALVTTAPTDSVGTGLVEVSAGGYARVAITNNAANFPVATGSGTRTKTNGTAIQFPTATAGWGTTKGIVFFDASTGGAFRAYAPFTADKPVVSGDVPTVAIGSLVITG